MPDQITKRQHYVPRVYLKGFSEDGKTIYTYSFSGDKESQPVHSVPIESVCQEKYLYEIRNQNNELVRPNWAEKKFSLFEGRFSEYRQILKCKAYHSENLYTSCFLSSQEKAFWTLWVSLQLLRSPQVLEKAEEIVVEESREKIDKYTARATALAQCLPFFCHYSIDDDSIFNIIITKIIPMNVMVGLDKTDGVYSADNPVYCAINKSKEWEEVIFPITSDLVLFFVGRNVKRSIKKNHLILLSDGDVTEINKCMMYTSFDRVFSKRPFPKELVKPDLR